jgi:hypothetical protein
VHLLVIAVGAQSGHHREARAPCSLMASLARWSMKPRLEGADEEADREPRSGYGHDVPGCCVTRHRDGQRRLVRACREERPKPPASRLSRSRSRGYAPPVASGPLEKDTCRDYVLPRLTAAGWSGVYGEFVRKPGVRTRDEGERRLPRCMEGGREGVAAASASKEQRRLGMVRLLAALRLIVQSDSRGCRVGVLSSRRYAERRAAPEATRLWLQAADAELLG